MALYIGLMSGTSMDGIDAALVDLSIPASPRLLAAHTQVIPPALRAQLQQLCSPGGNELETLARADIRLGRLFADAALAVMDRASVSTAEITAIGSHGQTIRHYPQADIRHTLQIGDPNLIAERTGVTTVADFRRRDMAAGGQGAPLAPAFHAAVFHQPGRDRVILNIGGMANITILPGDPALPVTGFDTGPGNTLLDAWSREHLHAPMDRDGDWAASGSVCTELLSSLEADGYFSRPPPKSTGREYFNREWLEERLRPGEVAWAAEDVAATLALLTARTVSRAVQEQAPGAREIIVCGGGVHNRYLMTLLSREMPGRGISSSRDLGIDPDWLEAMAFAWLAMRTLDGLPGNLPAVTGANRAAILGGIYPAGYGSSGE